VLSSCSCWLWPHMQATSAWLPITHLGLLLAAAVPLRQRRWPASAAAAAAPTPCWGSVAGASLEPCEGTTPANDQATRSCSGVIAWPWPVVSEDAAALASSATGWSVSAPAWSHSGLVWAYMTRR
jgi:hypothetical protein